MLMLTGLLVGSLDISAAFISYFISTGKGPGNVLLYIASGVFGKDAFSGGTGMMLWGLFFHYIIAFSFTFFYFWLFPKVKFIGNYPVWSAIFYGIFMWLVTTQVVVRLSNTPPPGPLKILNALKAIAILIVMISLPLTLIIGKYYRKTTATDL